MALRTRGLLDLFSLVQIVQVQFANPTNFLAVLQALQLIGVVLTFGVLIFLHFPLKFLAIFMISMKDTIEHMQNLHVVRILYFIG